MAASTGEYATRAARTTHSPLRAIKKTLSLRTGLLRPIHKINPPRLRSATIGPYFRKSNQDTFGKRSEEHTSELQSRLHLVCRLLLEKKKKTKKEITRKNIYIHSIV